MNREQREGESWCAWGKIPHKLLHRKIDISKKTTFPFWSLLLCAWLKTLSPLHHVISSHTSDFTFLFLVFIYNIIRFNVYIYN